jgi:hypothetical protein
MKDSDTRDSQNSPKSAAPQDTGFSPWQRLKTKRISYLTLPLIIMATVTEFVILATGWRYQQVVCVPQGMGVTFFGIGPIGATILAVELLKLPLAVWTASRHGWQKTMMILVGLPLICVLTFQLVKDMAVYEMGVAMTPASQMLEKAMTEETKISQLNGELAAIEQKKNERQQKLAEIAAKEAKAKADLDDSLKHNDDVRHDAISLTDYQKKELADVDNRESAIIAQFNADTAQLNKTLADLRARREVEVGRGTAWNAEEARIDNAYKAKMFEYNNKKAAYQKAKEDYDNASYVRRQFLKEPTGDPGVAPEREANKVLKPVAVADIDAEIKAKEAELLAVNNKRRDRVAQMETDARALRESFDKRSGTKREEADKKRDELTAAQAALAVELKAERKQADADLATSVQKVDGIRAQIDAARKTAEGYYEAREAAIRKTQVHRIATTVEIVRGLIKGERPSSIKLSAKERGDVLTDQISMVRIWVYPVLAFIVAFLPTLMVEIGFSTLFYPEQKRMMHRFGFFGRHLHWVEVRAGRQKILQAERVTKEAQAEIAGRDKAVAAKAAELHSTQQAMAAAAAQHAEQLQQAEAAYADQSKKREEEWVGKLSTMADTLNRTIIEKDALRDLQKSEVERQIQMRQNAWSDRLTQARQELDDLRATTEADRTALVQEQQKKLTAITEDCKSQIAQLRRQLADSELAAAEKETRLSHELKETARARDAAEAEVKHTTESLSLKLSQSQEGAIRDLEKATRQEKQKLDWQKLEFEKTLRQREESLERRMKQREQEISLSFASRLAEEKAQLEETARLREAERESRMSATALKAEEQSAEEIQKREEAVLAKLKQREQQLQAQADMRLKEAQTQAEEQAHARQLEFEHKLEAQSRAAEARLREELQQKDTYYQAKLKHREQDLAMRGEAYWTQEVQKREEAALSRLKQREQQLQAQIDGLQREAQTQADELMRSRQSEFERQLEAQSRGAETRLREELEQKEAYFHARLKQREQELAMRSEAYWAQELQKRDESAQAKLRQREQQLQAQTEVQQREAQAQAEELLRSRQLEYERQLEVQSRAAEARLREELEQKEANLNARLKQREQELTMRSDAYWAQEIQKREEAAQAKLKQREQQLLAQLEVQQREALVQSDELQRSRQSEFERQLEVQSRSGEARLREELQQKESYFHARLKQREEELAMRADARAVELQKQWASELRTREEDWERRTEARVSAAESRHGDEVKQKEDLFQSKLRQRDQQWQVKFEAARAEMQALSDEAVRRRGAEAEAAMRALETQLLEEMEQKDMAAQTKAKQREQEAIGQVKALWEAESEAKMFAAMESFKGLLARTEKERDDARQSAIETARQMENMERKLSEASSFFSSWKNG